MCKICDQQDRIKTMLRLMTSNPALITAEIMVDTKTGEPAVMLQIEVPAIPGEPDAPLKIVNFATMLLEEDDDRYMTVEEFNTGIPPEVGYSSGMELAQDIRNAKLANIINDMPEPDKPS